MQFLTEIENRCPSKVLFDVIAMLVIALVALVAYKLYPAWMPLAEHRIEAPLDCDLNKAPCRINTGSGWVQLGMTPLPIPLAKPFTLELQSSGVSISRVDVDFSGIGMNMGLHRPQLLPIAPGRFEAETSLPVCISGFMVWEVTLMVETSTGHLLVPFRLTTTGGIS